MRDPKILGSINFLAGTVESDNDYEYATYPAVFIGIPGREPVLIWKSMYSDFEPTDEDIIGQFAYFLGKHLGVEDD